MRLEFVVPRPVKDKNIQTLVLWLPAIADQPCHLRFQILTLVILPNLRDSVKVRGKAGIFLVVGSGIRSANPSARRHP